MSRAKALPARATRAPVAVLVLAGALVTVEHRAATAVPRETDTRPNIVLVVTDDQTLENQRVLSYVNTELGARGTVFSNAVVSDPVCCPSRATIWTGQYAHNHGVRGNHWPRGGYRRLDGDHTLATWLDAAGYFTAFAGKYMNEYGGGDDPPEVPPGWDDWFGKVGAGDVYYDYTVLDDDTLVHYGDEPADYSTDVYAAHAAEVILGRAGHDEPFFLQVAPLAPHGAEGNVAIPAPRHDGTFAAEPLPEPPSFNEANVNDKPEAIRLRPLLGPSSIAAITERYRNRLESLLAVDEMVRGIVDSLKAIGEEHDTLIIFTSDNGFLEGQHRVGQGKGLPYEESVRVPLLVAGPGFPNGAVVRAPVANIDIAPTILRAAGATADIPIDGIPLQDVAARPRDHLGRPVLLEAFGDGGYAAVRSRTWVYVEYDSGERELYDLGRDPYQLASRHESPALANLRSRLAAQLDELRRCAGASCQAS